ncbi:MAG: hypothetical protein ABIS18_11330 [Actinomycetota bacterium]
MRRQVVGIGIVVTLIASALALAAMAQTQSPPSNSSPVSPTLGSTPTSTTAPGPVGSTAVTATVTDTEYISVHIDANGTPLNIGVKEWYRVRKEQGGEVHVEDPGILDDVKSLAGAKPNVREDVIALDVDVDANESGCSGECGFSDVYIAGKPRQKQLGTWQTDSGPKVLPVTVKIRYYTGEPGSDEAATSVNARQFSQHHGPFKLVITVTNNTKQTEEVTYNDIQTKKQMTGIAEVSTPFNVKIRDIVLPDSGYDGITTNGSLGRNGKASVVSWNLDLAPPDFPNEQHAIIEGRANSPGIPQIDVVAHPVYPEPVAQALTSSEQQFQKGRRSFYYDVLTLLRENLLALGGLFSTLDDSFSNLALPLIGPEKNNRDSGTFTDANLLWGTWTISKGTEQLTRAVDDLAYSVQLARDAVKGQIATFQLLRAFLGKSTDKPVLASNPGGVPCVPIPEPLGNCTLEEAESQVDALLAESMWANLKDLEVTLGAPTNPDVAGGPNDPRPYLPEAPASLATNGALIITVLKIKMAILEHNFYCLQYEDHTNGCSTILGITNKPGATGWDKFSFVKFPFGQLEVEKGLRVIETEGLGQIRSALGNRTAPNSFVWGSRTVVEGVEGLVDSLHQLGATWRYAADSIQNFGVFGLDTSKSILQLDVNAIDIETAAKSAAVKRVTAANTFFGKPKGAQGQLILSFSTDPDASPRSSRNVALSGFGVFALLSTLLLFARFKWFLL